MERGLSFWIRHRFLQQTKHEKKAVSIFDKSEKLLLAAMFPPVILLPLLYLFTPLLTFADYRLPAVVPWLGAVTMVVTLWLFWRSHADLGQNWSVSLEIREGYQLVTHGVYRYVRHPMYASIWLWGLAQGLLLQNWLAGWSVVPVFAVMYFLRTPREERMMCDAFGEFSHASLKHTEELILLNCIFGRPMPDPRTQGIAPVALKFVRPLEQRIELREISVRWFERNLFARPSDLIHDLVLKDSRQPCSLGRTPAIRTEVLQSCEQSLLHDILSTHLVAKSDQRVPK